MATIQERRARNRSNLTASTEANRRLVAATVYAQAACADFIAAWRASEERYPSDGIVLEKVKMRRAGEQA